MRALNYLQFSCILDVCLLKKYVKLHFFKYCTKIDFPSIIIIEYVTSSSLNGWKR